MSFKKDLKKYGSRDGVKRRVKDSKLRKRVGSRGAAGGTAMLSNVVKTWAAHDASPGHNKVYIVYVLKVSPTRFAVKAIYGAITRDKLSKHDKGSFGSMSAAQSKAVTVFMGKLNKSGYEDIESAGYEGEICVDDLRRWIVAEELGIVEASEEEKAGLIPRRCASCNKFFMGGEDERLCDDCKSEPETSASKPSKPKKPKSKPAAPKPGIVRLDPDGSIVKCLDNEGVEDGFLVDGEYVGFECEPPDDEYIRVMDKFADERTCKRSRFEIVPE
jgi:hypothetical protein